MTAASAIDGADESDVGFKLGPRINAMGGEHANKIIDAFVSENPDELIEFMGLCNDRRKKIQSDIVERSAMAEKHDDPILFLGYEGGIEVVGITASKVVETYWKPGFPKEIGVKVLPVQ